MVTQRTRLGWSGEDLVAQWWAERGGLVVDRNWRCASGEIDLVVVQGSTLVICEVKTRTTAAFGEPVEMVGQRQRARLRRLAAQWMQTHSGTWHEVRLDVVGVLAVPGEPITMQHLPGVF